MNVALKENPEYGIGVVANSKLSVDDTQIIYGLVVDTDTPSSFKYGDQWFEPFPPFRYLNHSDRPNCIILICSDGTFELLVTHPILTGEQLTIDFGT